MRRRRLSSRITVTLVATTRARHAERGRQRPAAVVVMQGICELRRVAVHRVAWQGSCADWRQGGGHMQMCAALTAERQVARQQERQDQREEQQAA